MRLRVVHKLIALMLLLVGTAMATLALLTALNLRHGFVDYLNQLDLQRLAALARVLDARVADGGQLRDFAEPQRWHDFLQQHLQRPPHARPAPPPPPPRGPAGHRPPPPAAPAPPAPPHDGALEPRVSLLDTDGHPLIGPRLAPDALRQPLRTTNRVIGYLALNPLRQPGDQLETAFLHAQWQELAWTAGLLALLAVIAAAAFARHLLAPLRRVTTATARLATGDFEVRLHSQRRDELGDLLRHVDTVAQALARHEDARRRWMADMSHELRTPLAVLRGEIEGMQDGVIATTPQAIASLHEEVGRLQRLVDDLHQLALGELGALGCQRRCIDAAELVRTAAARFATRMQTADLSLTVSTAGAEGAVALDPHRIAQLLDNLLENSLRYTDRGGQVQITLKQRHGALLLSVDDSAPGVAEDERARLFEPLYRTEASRDRRHGGSGLGLAICRSIVLAHGGRIEALPSPLGGLRIEITLPLQES